MNEKALFVTWDEEYDYSKRLAEAIEKYLKDMELDTVNNQYIISVEILDTLKGE